MFLLSVQQYLGFHNRNIWHWDEHFISEMFWSRTYQKSNARKWQAHVWISTHRELSESSIKTWFEANPKIMTLVSQLGSKMLKSRRLHFWSTKMLESNLHCCSNTRLSNVQGKATWTQHKLGNSTKKKHTNSAERWKNMKTNTPKPTTLNVVSSRQTSE